MSHCTNFEFQYTDRRLIEKTFASMNLRCEDSTIYTYASQYDKEQGNYSQANSGIVAGQNGFNYFLENKGNHYELSIEKHNMTATEKVQSRQMAKIFQTQYVKNAALGTMDLMTKKGLDCILKETDKGFEIKFGMMYDKSLLIKLDNGRVVESVSGVKGEGCQALTEVLENLLSSNEVELNTQWTEEYYQTPDEELKVYNLVYAD